MFTFIDCRAWCFDLSIFTKGEINNFYVTSEIYQKRNIIVTWKVESLTITYGPYYMVHIIWTVRRSSSWDLLNKRSASTWRYSEQEHLCKLNYRIHYNQLDIANYKDNIQNSSHILYCNQTGNWKKLSESQPCDSQIVDQPWFWAWFHTKRKIFNTNWFTLSIQSLIGTLCLNECQWKCISWKSHFKSEILRNFVQIEFKNS